LFIALAAVMFLTRNIDWGMVGRRDDEPDGVDEPPVTPRATATIRG